MDSNKTNTISFTIDKLKSVVAKLNSLTDADSLDDKEQEKTVADIKKKINYIKKHCMECKGNLNLMSDSLIEILDLSSKFYKTYGDELTETIWSLYNDTDFILDVEDHLSSYEFFMHIFFLQSKKFHLLKEKNLIIIDISSNNIKANYNTKEIKELYHLPKEDNKERSVSYVNFLLDLILFKILSSSEVKHLYVSLSSFLVSIESSVMKFYKIISLFAIILWTLPDKENFANSLLYVIGGVMRDLGRSYLKTKGILNESLSYHNCKQAVLYFIIT